jgi:Mad1 and Cdc20-bound-Mad2 binding
MQFLSYTVCDVYLVLQVQTAATRTSDQQRLVQSVDTIFLTIQNIFSSGETVKQVLIVLGSNIFSPKESYLVSFPTEFYEGQSLARHACVSRLFRKLYTADFLGTSKSITSCTSLFVLFLVPRNCKHQQWSLTPRLSYKIPVVGARYAVNVVFDGSVVVQTNSGLNLIGEDLDISGIHPLDETDTNDSVTDSDTPVERNEVDIGSEEPDFVWFEAPVVVKGYKDKLT